MGNPDPPHQQQPGYAPPPPGYAPPPPGYAPPPPGYGQPPPPGYGPPHPGLPVAPPPARGKGLIIAIVGGAVVLALLVACGVGGFIWYRQSNDGTGGSADGERIPGLVDYRTKDPSALAQGHQEGAISYPMVPPAGGPHHQRWQNCVGDVYTAPIADGNAVHSLEHGAVWITYRSGLAASDVERLAARVRGQAYMMLSPHPAQTSPISLQAWGYQLAVDDADDERIDQFIRSFRETASMEPGATCGNGITTTTGP